MATERREKTTTEGRGLGHSWADDNIARGDPDVDFVRRRLKFPFGDDPRGREIDFEDTSGQEAYGSTKNQVYRAYRGKLPVGGQDPLAPSRVGSLPGAGDIRPELPNKTPDDAANAALQAGERGLLAASNYRLLTPSVSISSPSPGTTFSPGGVLTVVAPTTSTRNLQAATLEIDGVTVERRTIDRRDQDSTKSFEFRFIYNIPAARALGPMTITVRAFNITTALQGMVADDAVQSNPRIRTGVGTLDGRPGSATSAADYQPLLGPSSIMRTAEGVVSIIVNIV